MCYMYVYFSSVQICIFQLSTDDNYNIKFETMHNLRIVCELVYLTLQGPPDQQAIFIKTCICVYMNIKNNF